MVRRIASQRDASPIDSLIADQHDFFLARTANLSKSLLSAVKVINEEFVIWIKTHPDHAVDMHSDAFEQICGELLASHGFVVEFTGRRKNASADLLAIRTNENGDDVKYLVECKRFSKRREVGLEFVNAVIGASFRAKKNHAMLVTTSRFSTNAIREQAKLEEFHLELHDGKRVTEWLRDYRFKEDFGLWLPEGWEDKWRPD